MNNYNLFFGIEIHAELSTKTKAFSSAKVGIEDKPNTNISEFDIAYPGSRPTVNKKMVEYAYRLGKSLDMEIADTIMFDRKNYFYPDLAAGYQITQFYKPIGKNGKFEINVDGNTKEVRITQIQMEQDTAKQIIKGDKRLFDFNRAGVPLIEIISGHEDLKSIDEVIEYLKSMREQVIILNISDGNMHEGSFRIDINVSISKDDNAGGRVEIKNLNSFSNIRTALTKEIEEQIKTLEQGQEVDFVTKRFDEDSQNNIVMRGKDTSTTYNFIPEGNINPILLTDELKAEFNKFEVLKINDIKTNLLKGVADDSKSIILKDKQIFGIFQALLPKFDNVKAANIIVNIIEPVFNNKNKFEIKSILKVIDLLDCKKITKSETKDILVSLFSGKDVKTVIDNVQHKQMMSKENIKVIVKRIIASDVKTQEIIENNPDRASKFIVGQVMKETRGQASPVDITSVIEEVIN